MDRKSGAPEAIAGTNTQREIDPAGKTALVIGAGTMGRGIAYVLAQAGVTVTVVEPNQVVREDAQDQLAKVAHGAVARGKLDAEQANMLMARIETFEATPADRSGFSLAIEAIFENHDLKCKVLKQAESVLASDGLLATNTSALSVGALAEALTAPERFVGLHFFNPVWAMKLVEVVKHGRLAERVAADAISWVKAIGKTPVVVNDAPGFASSRLGIAIGMEAIRMVEEGVASPADIDAAMVLGYGFPMGPLKLTDLVGLDVRLAIATHLTEALGARFSPPQLLKDMVAEKKTGAKAGQGFYRWKDGKVVEQGEP